MWIKFVRLAGPQPRELSCWTVPIQVTDTLSNAPASQVEPGRRASRVTYIGRAFRFLVESLFEAHPRDESKAMIRPRLVI